MQVFIWNIAHCRDFVFYLLLNFALPAVFVCVWRWRSNIYKHAVYYAVLCAYRLVCMRKKKKKNSVLLLCV